MKVAMRRNTGFTLIELMITVAVVAILAAIAIPNYSEYVRRGRITDAISGLSGMRVKMEQYFQDNRTYQNACAAGSIASSPAPTGSFTFACSPAPSASAYTVTATGSGSMAPAVYSINESNQRTSTPPAGWLNSGCGWVLKKDGSC